MEVQDARPSGRSKRLAVSAGTVAVVAAAAFFGYSGHGGAPVSEARAAENKEAQDKDKKAKEPALVAVEEVREGPISAYLTATANLVAENEVEVVAETEGQVVALLVEEGDRVSRGQKLLQIDTRDAELAVDRAELALRNAQLVLDRSERMAAERLISPQELDKVRYERDLAAHELAEARRRLGKTTVSAPFAGKITLRSVQLGQAVKPNDALVRLADFDPLVARIFLPEREVIDLAVGQDAQLSLKAREDVRFRGRIRQISPVVDTASGTVKVTVEAIAPPPSVRPGAFVNVGVVRQTRSAALLIPRPAVVREIQDTYVFVADGGVARKRAVQLGLEEGDRVEVVSGLSAGEKVVTSGQGALKDAVPIRLPVAAAPADAQARQS